MELQHQVSTVSPSAPEQARRPRVTGKPNPVDAHVGNRLRVRRTLLGLSQEKVGEAMGLTFQQVQKYERGANRIGASRLWDMSRVLDCPVSYFFEEMDDRTADASPRNQAGASDREMLHEDDPLVRRETLELVRAYYEITDEHVRRRIYELARSLAAMEEVAAAAKSRPGAAANPEGDDVKPSRTAKPVVESRPAV
jgi:transcriptional regulator with XRE-family HTH domain